VTMTGKNCFLNVLNYDLEPKLKLSVFISTKGEVAEALKLCISTSAIQ
jgi:hypothetical protein